MECLCDTCSGRCQSTYKVPSNVTNTAKNTVISPNFLVWKFCEKAQFPQSFGRFQYLIYTSTYVIQQII